MDQNLLGRLKEEDLRVFGDSFREEIANTIALVEFIAGSIFNKDETKDLTVAETYAFLLCEQQKINDMEGSDEDKRKATLRLRRAVSVLSITYGVDVPSVLLGMDRNVYDTIQALNIIERNQKEIQALEKARQEAESAVAAEMPVTLQ